MTRYNKFELHYPPQVIHKDSLLILNDMLIKIIAFERHLPWLPWFALNVFTIAAIQSALKTLSHVFSQYVCEVNGWPILLSLLYLRGQPCSPKMLSPFGTFYLYRILLSVDFLKSFSAQDGFILFTLEIWREVTGFQKSQVFHPQFSFLIKINLVAFFSLPKKKRLQYYAYILQYYYISDRKPMASYLPHFYRVLTVRKGFKTITCNLPFTFHSTFQGNKRTRKLLTYLKTLAFPLLRYPKLNFLRRFNHNSYGCFWDPQ